MLGSFYTINGTFTEHLNGFRSRRVVHSNTEWGTSIFHVNAQFNQAHRQCRKGPKSKALRLNAFTCLDIRFVLVFIGTTTSAASVAAILRFDLKITI